jgi:hypothetical protein
MDDVVIMYGDTTVEELVQILIEKILNITREEAVRDMVELGIVKPPRRWYRQW